MPAGVHASQWLREQLQTLEVDKLPEERLGLNTKALIVCDCDAGSPAERAGCQGMVGMQLLSVNGRAVASAADIVTEARGRTRVSLAFAPRELPLTIECRGNETAHSGLTLTDGGVLLAAADGPGKRAGADQFVGLRVVSVNGQSMRNGSEAERALAACSQRSEGDDAAHPTQVTVGFGLPLPDAPQNAATVLPDGKLQEDVRRAKEAVHAMAGLSADDLELRLAAIDASSAEGQALSVKSPNKWTHCQGVYCVVPGELANGWPLWARDEAASAALGTGAALRERWLYATPNGYWRITDSREDFGKGAGFIISRDKHQGRMPYDMPMWQTKGYLDDPDVRVQTAEAPAPPRPGDAAAAAAAPGAAPAADGPQDVPTSVSEPQELKEGDSVRLLRTLGSESMGTLLQRGCAVTVVGVRRDGGVEVKGSSGHLHVTQAAGLWREHPDEAVLVKQPGVSIGMRFTGKNTLLRGVVRDSVAQHFELHRFAGRRVCEVGGLGSGQPMVPVQTPADLAAAVAPIDIVRLRFAPDPSAMAAAGGADSLPPPAPFAAVLAESEQAGRLCVELLLAASRVPLAQRGLALACSAGAAARKQWSAADAALRKAAADAIASGEGATGAQDAVAAHTGKLDALVECCQTSLRRAEAAEQGGAVPSAVQRALLAELRASVEAEEAERPRADALLADYRQAQERIDAADDALHRTKRQLSRRPGDAALQQRQEEEADELRRAESALSHTVDAMRLLAPSQPQLLGHVLAHLGTDALAQMSPPLQPAGAPAAPAAAAPSPPAAAPAPAPAPAPAAEPAPPPAPAPAPPAAPAPPPPAAPSPPPQQREPSLPRPPESEPCDSTPPPRHEPQQQEEVPSATPPQCHVDADEGKEDCEKEYEDAGNGPVGGDAAAAAAEAPLPHSPSGSPTGVPEEGETV
eukprot:TRINITY_DN24142_c0_g2_i2.p1 TRINITY_DN24142_c0_g2~~TRINITY_DN24142_c0_g2_i2.p1  ORF type:complete len:967 (+),score=267.07 TRINITY_DN24142_c0_g2_i2:139-2901(+)